MAYQIVFVKNQPPPAPGERPKGVGEHMVLADVPASPKVFVFYYPGSTDTRDVEKRLRALGQKSGDNLFVCFGKGDDPHYERTVKCFGLGPLPVIVVTAIAPLATMPDMKTAFVRLDSKPLFEKPDALVQTVEELFNLFLGGKFRQAAWVGTAQEGKAVLADLGERLWTVIKPVFTWIAQSDIKLGLADGTIEVSQSGRK